MKIVQLANFYSTTSGGLRTVVDTLGGGYQRAGHQRVLVVPGRTEGSARTDAGQVITLRGLPVSGGYRMVLRPSALPRLLDEVAAESVEVSDKATMLAAADWARYRGAGAVLFSHERLDRWLAARMPRLWRHAGSVLDHAVHGWNCGLANRFDTVVVTSAYAESEFATAGVRDLRRVPLGVDLSTFTPTRRPADPVTRLVYAGRLSPEKNPNAVIGAVRLLCEAGIPVRLDVYGDGVARGTMRRNAAGLPVTFHGHLTDRAALADALGAADIAFAPSAAETFGLSILEAMACGTPVVVASSGGAPELLGPLAGVAVPADPAGLASGVLQVLAWPVSERRAAARRRAEQYPWSATIAAMLDLHTSATR